MHGRTRTFFSFLVLVAALTAAGCAINQHARFQMAFLPPAAHGSPAATVELDSAPVVQPNVYLSAAPAFLVMPPLPPRTTQGDRLMQRAEARFEAGKRFYQAGNIAKARIEFDAAVDFMLDGSDQNPADRQEYERKLEAMVDSIHRFDLAGMGASVAVEDGMFEKAPLEDILQMTFPVDPKLKDRVQEQMAATVSQLPLAVNDVVLGYINYFSNRGRRTLLAGIARSGRYRPMIQRILDEEGIPQELINLAQAESGFIPRAVSRAAAGGMWQFLTWRGQQYGLHQTRYTDDRMDPERATHAAARHLHDLYNEFGDWYLAIAAYNCGPVAVEKAVERTGYADFWELRNRRALPAETTNYVPIIVAMTIMEKNASQYGLDGAVLDPPLEYETVELVAPTSLALLSDVTDTPASELAALNPAVLHGVAPAGYTVHVPKGNADQVTVALDLVPATHRESWRLHRAALDETLASIGKRYGVTPASLLAADKLDSKEPAAGDWVVIPVALRPLATVPHTASRVATVSRATAHAAASKTPARRRNAVTAAQRTNKANSATVNTTPASKTAPRPAVILANSGTK